MPANRPTARQAALMDALLALFLAEGFARFTLDDLAARLRCSKSTLYAIAPSKEQLAVKVVNRFFRQATERVEKRASQAVDAPAKVAAYLQAASDELAVASVAFGADVAAFAPTQAVYERNAQAAAARIREFIQTGVADGMFRPVHARLVGEMAGWLIEGIQTGVVGRRAGVSDADAFAALSDLLLVGLSLTARDGAP